jgi:antitoxin MazE
MRTSVQKWGNNLAIRIPNAFAQECQLGNGTKVDLQLQAGKLVITDARKRYRLSELMAQLRKTNRHAEVNWGRPEGA